MPARDLPGKLQPFVFFRPRAKEYFERRITQAEEAFEIVFQVRFCAVQWFEQANGGLGSTPGGFHTAAATGRRAKSAHSGNHHAQENSRCEKAKAGKQKTGDEDQMHIFIKYPAVAESRGWRLMLSF
jgi:hypothetical protein